MSKIQDAIMGFCVADALGVPVEFMDRESLRQNPVIDMCSYGTYNLPAGTWSDDTSMTLGLVDSLIEGLDYMDIMMNFKKWLNHNAYTPLGFVFGVGNTTREAITAFERGSLPLESGSKEQYDNGNGSLMRILPMVFYLDSINQPNSIKISKAYEKIHNVSALTHGHKRSQMACGIYISIASMLLHGMNLSSAVRFGISNAMDYYKKHFDFKNELTHFKRLNDYDFIKTDVRDIKSTGYVVDTLEAAIWCLLNTESYRECVLKAVNLGLDTDTIAAVAGGLAGIHYGYESIPEEWLNKIARRSWIEDLCQKLEKATTKMK